MGNKHVGKVSGEQRSKGSGDHVRKESCEQRSKGSGDQKDILNTASFSSGDLSQGSVIFEGCAG